MKKTLLAIILGVTLGTVIDAGSQHIGGGISGFTSTGTGPVARQTSPTFITPTLGAATMTRVAAGVAINDFIRIYIVSGAGQYAASFETQDVGIPSVDLNNSAGAGDSLLIRAYAAGAQKFTADYNRANDRPRLTGTAAGIELVNPVVNKITNTAFTFANIATVLTVNGDMAYCSDCTIANPCAGGGTGAIAKRLNAVNVCN